MVVAVTKAAAAAAVAMVIGGGRVCWQDLWLLLWLPSLLSWWLLLLFPAHVAFTVSR